MAGKLKLFLHIRISSELHHFSSSIISVNDKVQYFNIDNFSDALTINTSLQALERSEQLLLFLEVVDSVSLGGISKVLNGIAKLDIPFHIVYNGSHAMLNKMISRFKTIPTSGLSISEIREAADIFFNN